MPLGMSKLSISDFLTDVFNTYKKRKLPSLFHGEIIRLRKIKNRLRDLMNREDNINSLFA